ncbi:MAG: hypothetical protein K1060chlam5_00738 [Candidatus Anoxychlamydiales bacterium]|nr:hypothetical protein [Candidatus Anoxychlamydiales bacterium]
MITKEDVKEMIKQIKNSEMQMHQIYDHLSEHVSDENLKKEFIAMKDEEIMHLAMAQELEDLLIARWRSLD